MSVLSNGSQFNSSSSSSIADPRPLRPPILTVSIAAAGANADGWPSVLVGCMVSIGRHQTSIAGAAASPLDAAASSSSSCSRCV